MERCVMKGVYPKTNDIFLKGFELFEQQQYEDALKAFEASARAKPDDADVHYGLGLMYLLTGDRGSAMEEHRILKTLNSNLSTRLLEFISPPGQFSLKV
jgi:Flp pilus assembly protein TadD